jgi:hypothetical protein
VQRRVGELTKGFRPVGEPARPVELCADGARFIGYAGDTSTSRWKSADIVRMSAPRRLGALTSIDMLVRNHFVPSGQSAGVPPRPDQEQRDRVYLIRIGGRWSVAKLSALADTAVIGRADPSPPLEPPNLAAERASLLEQRQMDKNAEQRARATATDSVTDCARVGPVKSVGDPLGDVTPNVAATDRGPVRVPELPGLDLRNVSVARAGDTLCADFVATRDIAPPLAMTVSLREEGRGDLGSLIQVTAFVPTPGSAVLSLRPPGADESPGEGVIDGEVAVSGSRLSIVVNRREFPSAYRRVFDRFEWEAQSVYRGRVTAYPQVEFTDQVPNRSTPNIPYP